MHAASNPTAARSFCFANYPAAIPVSPNIRACPCFSATATKRTRNKPVTLRFPPLLVYSYDILTIGFILPERLCHGVRHGPSSSSTSHPTSLLVPRRGRNSQDYEHSPRCDR